MESFNEIMPYAKTRSQQISVLKKSISCLKAELICKNEIIDQFSNQVENLQNELEQEKHERAILEQKNAKQKQKLIQLGRDFKEFCEKLKLQLKGCFIKQGSEFVPFQILVDTQNQMDIFVTSLENEDKYVRSDIRREIQKTIKLMEEMVDLMEAFEDVPSSPGTPVIMDSQQGNDESMNMNIFSCGICSNSFTNEAIFSNHQKICRREGPSTSKGPSAPFPGKATRASANENATSVMGPPPTRSLAPQDQNTIFCNLARYFAKSSSSTKGIVPCPKFDVESSPSVVAVTVLQPTKTFTAKKHRRDVTKRHDGYFCHCEMRFVTRNGLTQHQLFHIKSTTKNKGANLSQGMKKEKND